MKIISQKSLYLVIPAIVFSPLAMSDLKMLDDTVLSGINGQSGVSLDLNLHAKVGGISYFDDGNGITLENVEIGRSSDISQAAAHSYNLDILNDSSLAISYSAGPTRVSIGDIKLSDNAVKGMGGIKFDYEMTGNYSIKQGGTLGSGGYTTNSNVSITNGRFAYETQGNELSLDGITLNMSVLGMTYSAVPGGMDIRMPSVVGDFSVKSIHLNNGTKSAGEFKGDFDFSQNIQMKSGGRVGAEGMSFDIQQIINKFNFAYGDDGYWIGLLDVTGSNIINNLTLDVAKDATNQLGLEFAFDSLASTFKIGQIVLGASTGDINNFLGSGNSNTLQSLGQVDVNLFFADQVVNGVNYTNKVHLQGGGDLNAGNQGLRINAEWSLLSDSNQSNIVYTEDGNSVMLSGLSSWGKGYVTANVTTAGVINGTEYFDGLRFGFEDLTGGYKIEGLRVGKDDGSLRDQKLQGGSELLLAMGVFPAYDFTVNGHITVAPGGKAGSGITINSDIHITNGNAALTVDENGSGLWVSDLDYDMHTRNMTIDIDSKGLSIIKGESWSTMDIGNLRIGDKSSGGSFGRFVLQRYEKNSSMTISSGGAGVVNVGGVTEDRGSQGVTISLKNIFSEAVSNVKRNRFAWETNGMQLVFDNFTTNDGVDGQNTYGLQNEINVDIFKTKVVSKSNGAVTTPLGFAIKARTSFKELSVGSVKLIHSSQYDASNPVNSGSTILYGMKIQNVDIVSNLTATPIP